MSGGVRCWWGWGAEGAQLSEAAIRGLGDLLHDRFGYAAPGITPVPAPGDVAPGPPQVSLPQALAGLADPDPAERLRHGRGNAYRDVVRAVHGDVPTPPDRVLRPRDPAEVAAVLDWCADQQVACIPFGGGTSVVGGVTPPDRPTVSLDLQHLDRVLDVDPVSLAARIQGGALGPQIEDQLRPQGLTLRHFPQSWEFSTLGGWIATRAGGHFATGPTHIDDLVEAVTAVTPAGTWASRRLPASGAGPSPDRLLLGSEGILGVIVEAWVRVQQRPSWRGRATLAFPDFTSALTGLRTVVQAGLQPADARLLDPTEAALSGAAPADGTDTLLLLGFESAHAPRSGALAQAVEAAQDAGGTLRDGPTERHGDRTATSEGSAAAWRQTFLQAPYLRDALVRLSAIAETFETAITWDRAADLVHTLQERAREAACQVAGAASVSVRTTHAYPNGVAPYLTVVAPGPPGVADIDGPARGRLLASAWDDIKVAVSEELMAAGATITHHHAVGRDHRPWYDRQRPEPFALALYGAKQALDPAGVLNPGVLLADNDRGRRPA